MKSNKNVDKYKAKIIELADKLLEKEKECSRLRALKSVHETRIESLDKQIIELESHSKSLDKFILEQQWQINGLEHRVSELLDRCIQVKKQRDNWKADCEYNEQCFQAEREARYKLEDEIRVLKGQKTYPCISLNCNDITGESSSLYFCFSYDDRVLLANNVPRLIFENYFQIHANVDRLGLTYYITCPPVLDPKTNKPYVYFKVLHDTKQLIDYTRPLDWMNYCNNKSNKDIEEKGFQKYCFLGPYNCLNVCLSEIDFIMLDRNPELWIQNSDRWKIWYDNKTREGLVQIYDKLSLKAATYYIEDNKVKKVIIGE